MWWQIIKSDDIEIHIDDLITGNLQENAKKLGVENLDIRMKDRLVGAGIPVGNDGIITDKDFFDWLDENEEYKSNFTPDFRWKLNVHSSAFHLSIFKEALYTIIEIEDSKVPQLESRDLFTMGRGQQRWRNIALNPEVSQRTVPEDEET